MEEAKAVAKYIRIAPRKLRIVINLIRGKSVNEAFAILKYTPKVGSEVIEKVLRSAVANAENNFDMNVGSVQRICGPGSDHEKNSSTLPWTGIQDPETLQSRDCCCIRKIIILSEGGNE